MRHGILIDAGPMVALFRKDDNHHAFCVAAIKTMRPPLYTTWPPITEALYLLETPEAQDGLLDMVARDVVRVLPLDVRDVEPMRVLMQKYRDLPMDFADASLVCVAHREGISRIFTLDRRDFSVYRGTRGRAFTLIV